MPRTVAERYVEALAKRDQPGLRALLSEQVDFKGMTPSRFWESTDPREVVEEILGRWFEEWDVVEEILALDRDWVIDREHVGYRFRVRCPDGHYVVEQQAYLTVEDGLITWMRVMCSGFRKVDSS